MLILFFVLHINALLLLYVSITIMASLGVFQLSFASKKNTDDGLTKKYCCSQFYISLAMLDWRVYQNIRFIVFAALGDIQYGWSSGSCRRLVDVSAQSTNGQGQFIAFLFFVRCSFIGSEASIDSRVIVTIVNRKKKRVSSFMEIAIVSNINVSFDECFDRTVIRNEFHIEADEEFMRSDSISEGYVGFFLVKATYQSSRK